MKASTQARQLRIIEEVIKIKDDNLLKLLEELLEEQQRASLSEKLEKSGKVGADRVSPKRAK
jgi:hypothetical protein